MADRFVQTNTKEFLRPSPGTIKELSRCMEPVQLLVQLDEELHKGKGQGNTLQVIHHCGYSSNNISGEVEVKVSKELGKQMMLALTKV